MASPPRHETIGARATAQEVVGSYDVLYSFTGGSDGANPYAGLIQATDGNFYGTTFGGGGASGYGTAFRMDASGSLTTLYSFAFTDGVNPYAGLIQATDGNFYGTTYAGGTINGAVFKIDAAGNFTRLFAFFGGTLGALPRAGLIQAADGNLYGTTSEVSGGIGQSGTAYKMDVSGNLTTLHQFVGSDGASPYAGLIQATDGNFYGTTYGGGASSYGTAFKVDASGNFTTLYSFAGGSDGANPSSGLIQATDGNFYGTTGNGGAIGYGTAYKMDASGNLTTLHSFAGSDGSNPSAGLIQATDGNFYGTTYYGGASGYGTAYKMDASGNLTTLHSFAGSDGANPYAGLIQATDGNFYGTTYQGGAGQAGVIFKIISNTPMSSCTSSATTLCIDDQPGDGRFQIQVTFRTAQGGGVGQAIPLSSLGVTHGGLMWFFSADNPELLIKVLPACSTGSPGHWVFASAGTNVGVIITVTDLKTGVQNVYTNPNGTPMQPIQDVPGFSCP